MTQAVLLILLGLIVLPLLNWRLGLYCMVMTAVLQDVVRKLTPGEPVYFVVLVGVVFAATCAAAVVSGVSLSPRKLQGWQKYLSVPFALFLALLVFQGARGFISTGSTVIVGIGLLAYLAPIPAVVFSYQYAVRLGPDRIGKFFAVYVAVVTVAAAAIYAEYTGVEWPFLGEVGSGLMIYDKLVGALSANSGLFRSSEVASWHIATGVCLMLLLIASNRVSGPRAVLLCLLVVALLAIGALTGRRKLYVEVAIFCCAFWALSLYFGRHATKLAAAVACIGAIGYAYFAFFGAPTADVAARPTSEYQAFVVRSQSVAGDVGERFESLGLGSIFWAYRSTGFLGSGLGTASQGAQHFGGGSQGAAEGGLGKIVVELGIPGLLIAVWFALSLARLVWRTLRSTPSMSPNMARLTFGLAAFLLANIAAFSVAAQVFGDVFVLLLLGTCLGFLLATPVMTAKSVRQGHQGGVRVVRYYGRRTAQGLLPGQWSRPLRP